MSIAIITAIKTVLSKKYSKYNFVLFILFLIAVGVLIAAGTTGIALTNTVAGVIFMLLSTILLTFFQIGYISKTTNNAIKLRKGIFASPFENILHTIATGFKFTMGVLGLTLLYSIPMILIVAICTLLSMKVHVALCIIIGIVPYALVIYYTIVLLCTAELSFYNSLNFIDFFGFKQLLKRFKENKRVILCLIGKRILLVFVTTLIITLPIAIISKVTSTESTKTIFNLIESIAGLINTLIITVITIELNGQAGRLIFFKENQIEQKF